MPQPLNNSVSRMGFELGPVSVLVPAAKRFTTGPFGLTQSRFHRHARACRRQ